MAEPFVGEIRLMSFDFAPKGWAMCNGQSLPINQNQALYFVLGSTYGSESGAFNLPDLRGRVPMHMGRGYALGERPGAATHALTVGELPTHTHRMRATAAAGSTDVPTDAVPAAAANRFGTPTALTPLHPSTVALAGSGQPHENMQPYLTLTFCIALQGVLPSP